MNNTIKCPKCGEQIEIDKVFVHQVREEVATSLEENHRKELAEAIKQAEHEVLQKLSKDFELQLKTLQKERDEEKDRSSKLLKQLESLTDEIRQLRRKDEERELEMKRKLIEGEGKIKEELSKKFIDEHELKDREKDQKMADLVKQIELWKSKAQQGSQQLQGEVLELDLEDKLRAAFIYDEVFPIGKGVEGGDIIQKVKNQAGKVAGTILWETKRAKWSPSWLSKLREDGRKFDATLIILVAVNLPKEIENFQVTDNVIVTSYKYALPLAGILRRDVMKIASAKFAAENKDEKLEFLYQYLQSEAFRSRFEAFAEGVTEMQSDLLTEKRAMERSWKRRETQIVRTINNVSKMYGELQGIMGPALPDIKILQLESGEDE